MKWFLHHHWPWRVWTGILRKEGVWLERLVESALTLIMMLLVHLGAAETDCEYSSGGVQGPVTLPRNAVDFLHSAGVSSPVDPVWWRPQLSQRPSARILPNKSLVWWVRSVLSVHSLSLSSLYKTDSLRSVHLSGLIMPTRVFISNHTDSKIAVEPG